MFINPGLALPTGQTFSRLDDMRHDNPALVPHMDTTALAQALVTGDPRRVAAALHNDLEPAAVALRPQLRRLLTVASEYGLNAVVSGSGPDGGVFGCRLPEGVQRLQRDPGQLPRIRGGRGRRPG